MSLHVNWPRAGVPDSMYSNVPVHSNIYLRTKLEIEYQESTYSTVIFVTFLQIAEKLRTKLYSCPGSI